MGGDAIAAQVKQLLGIGFHETAKDGSVTLEPVYCLGLCACAPSAMLDGEVIGRLDADKLDEIVAGGAGMSVDDLHPPRFRRAGARRRKGRQGDRARDRGARPRRRRSCATARAALYWLEPMVEVETRQGRVAYGPVAAKDVASLFDAGLVFGRRASGCRSATPKKSPSSPSRPA